MIRPGRAGLAALLLCLAGGSVAAAQGPGLGQRAAQLASEGHSDSARALLAGELRRAAAGSPAWVEALYWRGRLAATGDSAERDFRRVAIEYSGSPWADDALLQLAQLALTAGNAAGAFELATRLRSDYPDSELRPQAALWAARAAFVTGEARAACRLLDAARREAAGQVEFLNQVEFFRARCGSISAGPPAAGAAPPPPRSAADSQPIRSAPADTSRATGPAAAGFEVQVTATRSDGAARDIVTRLTRAGHPARVVTSPDGLRRVRMGPYGTRAAADSAALAARRITGGAPFVVAPGS